MKNYERITGKFNKDYEAYVKREIARPPIEIFRNCFEYAIAEEWMCFFDNEQAENYESELENSEVFTKIMAAENLVGWLVREVEDCSEVEFNTEAFSRYFESAIWTLTRGK